MFNFIKQLRYRHEMRQKGLIGNNTRRVNKKKPGLFHFFTLPKYAAGIVLTALFLLTGYAILFPANLPKVPHLVEKQTAPVSVYAAFPFIYEDTHRTQEFRDVAMESVPMFYRVSETDIQRLEQILQNVPEALKARVAEDKTIHTAQQQTQKDDKNPAAFIRELDDEQAAVFNMIISDSQFRKTLYEKLEDTVYAGILSNEDKSLPWTIQLRIIDPKGRTPSEVHIIKDIPCSREAAYKIAQELTWQAFPVAERQHAGECLASVLQQILEQVPMKCDKKYTAARRREAAEQIVPIMVDISKNQCLIRQDDEVNVDHLQALAAYEKELKKRQQDLKKNLSMKKIAKAAASSLLLTFFLAMFFSQVLQEYLQYSRKIYLLGLLTAASIGINILLHMFFYHFEGIFSIPPRLLFLVPAFAFPAIVITSIFNTKPAVFISIFVVLVEAFMEDGSFDALLTGILVSGIAVHAVSQCWNYRSHFFRGFFAVSLATLLMAAILVVIHEEALPMIICIYGQFFKKPELVHQDIISMAKWMLALPFLTALVTVGLSQIVIFMLEFFFNCTTRMSLLLYGDYNHPLLKRLQIEAPGTYHHCLIVSLLAETAAKEIKADPVLARVSALFHDVGKLAHPEYFSENCSGESKLQGLSPKFSAMVIINHVKEGLEFGRKYKLKRPMLDVICQHHGTDFVQYFYHRAKESGIPFDEHDYQYPGPLPDTKESVIISLADACEAASRSLDKVTHAKIDDLVSEIIMHRLRTGQLNHAELTFCELNLIRESFIKTLIPMLHSRVAYPKDENQENEDDLFMAAPSADKKADDAE